MCLQNVGPKELNFLPALMRRIRGSNGIDVTTFESHAVASGLLGLLLGEACRQIDKSDVLESFLDPLRCGK